MDTEIRDRFLMKFDKQNTVKTYKGNIDIFYEFVLARKTFDTDKDLLGTIGFNDVEDYFYDMKKNNKYKKSTMNLKIEVLNEFFDFAVRRRIMAFNLTDTIDKFDKSDVKKEKTEKYVPTINEIKMIVNATYEKKLDARCQSFNNTRNRFLIALLCTTGLRIEEALGIKIHDMDQLSNGCYMINVDGTRVKNGINKRVPITKGVLKYFYEYEKERDLRNEKFNSDLLFFSINGKKLTGNKTNELIRELCVRVGIEENITNHCFRHFLTTYLRSKGYDNGLVYKIMGWSERGIDTEYGKEANNKEYDKLKLKMCNVLG